MTNNDSNIYLKDYYDKYVDNINDEKMKNTLEYTLHLLKTKIDTKLSILQMISNIEQPITTNCWINSTELHYKNGVNTEPLNKQSIIDLVNIETESTAYILKIILESCISIDDSRITLSITTEKKDHFKGIWSEDSKYFSINGLENNHSLSEENSIITQEQHKHAHIHTHKDTHMPQKKLEDTYVIMGFGPSASGKTYNAKTIIKHLNDTDKKFPKLFLTIDGGIYRSNSIIYRYIVDTLNKKNIAGLSDLMSEKKKSTKVSTEKSTKESTEKSIKKCTEKSTKKSKLCVKSVNTQNSELKIKNYDESIFDAGKIKKIHYEFLKKHEKQMNLYIPETLGSCDDTCKKKYNQYVKFGKLIKLLIYQHKTNLECPFDKDYMCKGCTESGEEREKDEGKIYSNKSWESAMLNGLEEMKNNDSLYRFIIHNSGDKRRKSIIYEVTENTSVTEKIKYFKNLVEKPDPNKLFDYRILLTTEIDKYIILCKSSHSKSLSGGKYKFNKYLNKLKSTNDKNKINIYISKCNYYSKFMNY